MKVLGYNYSNFINKHSMYPTKEFLAGAVQPEELWCEGFAAVQRDPQCVKGGETAGVVEFEKAFPDLGSVKGSVGHQVKAALACEVETMTSTIEDEHGNTKKTEIGNIGKAPTKKAVHYLFDASTPPKVFGRAYFEV